MLKEAEEIFEKNDRFHEDLPKIYMQFGIYYTKASYNFDAATRYFLWAAEGNKTLNIC